MMIVTPRFYLGHFLLVVGSPVDRIIAPTVSLVAFCGFGLNRLILSNCHMLFWRCSHLL